jgi:hypothetical protein
MIIDPNDEVIRLSHWELDIMFEHITVRHQPRVQSKIQGIIRYWQSKFLAPNEANDEVIRLTHWENDIRFEDITVRDEARVQSKILALIRYWQSKFPRYYPHYSGQAEFCPGGKLVRVGSPQ